MKFVIIAALALLAFAGTGTATANAGDAKLCQKDGWQSLYRADGSSFANRPECVQHARGNTIYGGRLTATFGSLICPISADCFWDVRIAGVGLQPGSFVYSNAPGDGSIFVPLYAVNVDGTVAGGCGCDISRTSFTVTATDRFGNTLTAIATRPA